MLTRRGLFASLVALPLLSKLAPAAPHRCVWKANPEAFEYACECGAVTTDTMTSLMVKRADENFMRDVRRAQEHVYRFPCGSIADL